VSTQQLHDRLADGSPVQVPQGGVETCQRPAAITAGELVLALLYYGDEFGDVPGVLAQDPGSHLAMDDLGGDVGVIGRRLSPAEAPVGGRDPHEADELVGVRLDAVDQAQGAGFEHGAS